MVIGIIDTALENDCCAAAGFSVYCFFTVPAKKCRNVVAVDANTLIEQ